MKIKIAKLIQIVTFLAVVVIGSFLYFQLKPDTNEIAQKDNTVKLESKNLKQDKIKTIETKSNPPIIKKPDTDKNETSNVDGIKSRQTIVIQKDELYVDDLVLNQEKVINIESFPMLNLSGTGTDETQIDYAKLPVLKGTHAIVCPFDDAWKFQLHNYLLHHEGKFWCMWSCGPEVEDLPTQFVRYATSDDGLKWNTPKTLSGPPAEGRAYIARDFWLRDGELLGLAASYKGRGAFGIDKDLRLVAFVWDKAVGDWKPKGQLYENAINNFAPQKLSTGEWITTRRDARFNVTMLIGGVKAFDDWRATPVVDRMTAVRTSGFSPDEPVCWEQVDGTLVGAIRDNGGSSRLFRTFSKDHGQTWSFPKKTNYPNASSKLFTLQTSRGYRVLVSNANPKIGRREMHLAVSDDGVTFTRLGRLDIPMLKATTFQYPHVIEHEGSLFIAFSNKKAVTELLKVSLDEVDRLRRGELSPAGGTVK